MKRYISITLQANVIPKIALDYTRNDFVSKKESGA